MDEKTTPIHEKKKSFLQRILLNSASFLMLILHAVPSLTIIFLLAYFLAYSLITDPLSGNDATNNLNYIIFFNKNFPHIPLWAPQMGGGASATLGYPQLYSYVVIILHRLTHLTILSTMGIVNFACVLLPAWGIYFFVALRFKSKTGGLLAGIFFLLSPLVYVWISGAGFLAQVFSVIFVPPFLILYDWLLESSLRQKINLIALFLLMLIGLIAFLAHPSTFQGLIAFAGLYTAGMILVGGRQEFKKRVIWGFGIYIISLIAMIGLAAFWYLPLQTYLAFANRDLRFSLDTSVYAQVKFIGTLGLWGPSTGYPYADFSVYPPIWILAIVACVLGFFYQKKVALFGLFAIMAIYFTGSLTPYIILSRINIFFASVFTLRPWYPLAAVLNPIAAAMGAVFIARLILSPLFWLETKKLFLPIVLFIKSVRIPLFTVLSFLVAGVLLSLFNPLAGYYDSHQPWILPIGSTVAGFNTRQIWNRTHVKQSELDLLAQSHNNNPIYTDYFDLNTLFLQQCDRYPADKKTAEIQEICTGAKVVTTGRNAGKTNYITREDVVNFISHYCNEKGKTPPYLYPKYSLCLALGHDFSSQIKRWPVVSLQYGEDDFSSLVGSYDLTSEGKKIITGASHRVDVSPQLGTTIKNWGILYPSATIGVYTGQIGLIKTYYSLLILAMYESKQTAKEVLNSLGNYFGLEAIVVNPSTSPMQSFALAGWKALDGGGNILKPPFQTGIATISNTPKILVIGNKKNEVYKEIFAAGNTGILPFENGLLVEGPEKVGDVSLLEMSQYAGVILQGYGYRARGSDIDQLRQYVSAGGSVFVDTGWQYISADWGIDQNGTTFTTDLPEPFPVLQTTWGGIGKDWSGGVISSQFSKNVSLNGFGPLVWGNTDWALASATQTRDFAKPILTKNDKILIAGGQYGKGKIVWSGMNIIAHFMGDKSSDEQQLLTNIFSYLISQPQSPAYKVGNLQFVTPEKAVITVGEDITEGQTVYFREAYYPSWKAYVVHNNQTLALSIHVAGPQFMEASLPHLSAGDTIVFMFDPPIQLIIGIVISLFTLVAFLVATIDIVFFRGKVIFPLLHKASRTTMKKPLEVMRKMKARTITNIAKEEEDY